MLIDVTASLFNGMKVWPGDTPFERTAREVGPFSSSKVTMSLHSGTHMDAPSHRIKDGRTVDEIFPFVVPVLVNTDGDPRGKAVFFEGPVTAAQAQHLVDSGAVLAGTSSISIDFGESEDAHVTLLGADIPIVENLVLDGVHPGEYIALVFPLKVEGADGSPVRVLLTDSLNGLIC